ncbi:MAG: glycosyltransferase family 9 protein [Planctomycetota bacterium]|nr:glycosyltransferase family 9 protein [Planctomycetota bacterium]
MRPLPSEPLFPRSILVVRLSALGDLIQVLPALEALSEHFPEARIDAVTESLSSGLLQGHPALDRVISLPRSELKQCWKQPEQRDRAWPLVSRFTRELRQQHYDLLIDWQSNFRSALVRMLARADRVIGIHPEDGGELPRWWRGHHPPQRAGRIHRSDRALTVVRALGWDGATPLGQLGDVDGALDQTLATTPRGRMAPILLHPFVSHFGRFKEWPTPRWSALARSLARRGHCVWISGGAQDQTRIDGIVTDAGNGVVAAPETKDLTAMAALLGRCQGVIAADTGILHLAAIRRIPCIGLYGPKDPAIYAPREPWTRILRSGIPCSPCTLRHCDHSFCMSAISVAVVEQAILELLGETGAKAVSH